MNGNSAKRSHVQSNCREGLQLDIQSLEQSLENLLNRQREQTRDLLDRAERILALAVRLALMVNDHSDHVVVLSESLADLIQAHRKILSGQCILMDKKIILEALEANEAKKKPLDHRRVLKRTLQSSPKSKL